MTSFLGLSRFSTSDLRRRSRKGRSTACSRSISELSPKQLLNRHHRRSIIGRVGKNKKKTDLLVLNHSSKSSDELKTSGSRKLSSAHSSCRLFCNWNTKKKQPMNSKFHLKSWWESDCYKLQIARPFFKTKKRRIGRFLPLEMLRILGMPRMPIGILGMPTGVPVRRSRLLVLNSRMISESFDFSFLMRCASSMTM